MLLAIAVVAFGFYLSLVLLALLASASRTAPLQAPLERNQAAAARNSAAATYSNTEAGGKPVTSGLVSTNNGRTSRIAS